MFQFLELTIVLVSNIYVCIQKHKVFCESEQNLFHSKFGSSHFFSVFFSSQQFILSHLFVLAFFFHLILHFIHSSRYTRAAILQSSNYDCSSFTIRNRSEFSSALVSYFICITITFSIVSIFIISSLFSLVHFLLDLLSPNYRNWEYKTNVKFFL